MHTLSHHAVLNIAGTLNTVCSTKHYQHQHLVQLNTKQELLIMVSTYAMCTYSLAHPSTIYLYFTRCMLQESTVLQARRQTGDRRHPSTSESLVCMHTWPPPVSPWSSFPPWHPTLPPHRPTSMCFSIIARLTNTWQRTQSGHTGIGYDRTHPWVDHRL